MLRIIVDLLATIFWSKRSAEQAPGDSRGGVTMGMIILLGFLILVFIFWLFAG